MNASRESRDDPILMHSEKAKWKPLTSGVNSFIRWTDARMKASAFDVAQTTLATPYLNSTASAIDILFDMEHHARDVVLGAFVREAARDDDPSTLLDYSGVVPAMTQIQKYLYWRQAATVGAASRFGDWSFRKSKALYMNVDTALKARKKEALATGAGDAPLDGGAVVAQVEA